MIKRCASSASARPYVGRRREGGGRGGGGGGGRGGGGGGQEGEGGGGVLVLPSHRQPKSIGGNETSLPDVGAHLWVYTEGPPPPTMALLRGGRGLRGGE